MKTILNLAIAITIVAVGYAADDVVSALHGTIDKIDSGARTIVIKTDDGTHHTLHLLDRTAVHGGDASSAATKDSWHGLREGGEIVAHYTKGGTEDTAVEIDRIGHGGLKTAKGTVMEFDRGGKNLVLDTGAGAKETFRLSEHTSEDAGKEIGKAAGKGSHVTVYYTEDAGKKVAHFFEAL